MIKIPIDILFENCKKAVNKEIRKECRKEAIRILELCDDKDRQNFLGYSKKEGGGNVCCLLLDFEKKRLVDEGKMEQKPEDCFKNPYTWINETI